METSYKRWIKPNWLHWAYYNLPNSKLLGYLTIILWLLAEISSINNTAKANAIEKAAYCSKGNSYWRTNIQNSERVTSVSIASEENDKLTTLKRNFSTREYLNRTHLVAADRNSTPTSVKDSQDSVKSIKPSRYLDYRAVEMRNIRPNDTPNFQSGMLNKPFRKLNSPQAMPAKLGPYKAQDTSQNEFRDKQKDSIMFKTIPIL